MELPILKHLPMPDVAVRLVTQFLRKPHPAVAMIKALTFSRYSNGFSIIGETVRYHRMNTFPPKYCRVNVATVLRMRQFNFDASGEFYIDSDSDDSLTIDDYRMAGFGEDELSAMGYEIMEVAGRNSFRALGFRDDELSTLGYEITN
jgi:hypothetical protein